MSEENRFCTACGASLPEGSVYCPECGRPVGGGANPYAAGPAPGYREPAMGRKSSTPLFILLYGAFGLVFGLLTLSDGITINEQVYNEMLDYVTQITGMDASSVMPAWSDSMKTQMIVSGAFMVASPVCALLSYYFCWRNGPWKNAIVLCVLADVLVLGVCAYFEYIVIALPLFVIGLFVTFRLYNERPRFAS